MNRPSLILLFSLLAAGCGGPLISAELDIPEVCHDVEALEIPGMPPGAPEHLRVALPVTLPAELQELGEDVDVELLGISGVARGVEDLSFLFSASVSVHRPEGDQLIAEYIPGSTAGDELVFKAVRGVDLSALLAGPDTHLQASLIGVMPNQPWTLTTRVCNRVVATAAVE